MRQSPKANTILVYALISPIFLVFSILIVHLQSALTIQGSLNNFVQFEGNIFSARILPRFILKTLSSEPLNLPLFTVNFALQIIAVFMALYAVFFIAQIFCDKVSALLSSILVALMLPWGFLTSGYSISYPYDLLSLCFTSFGLYAIVTRSKYLFYVIIILGTLNKESIVWLIPAFFLSTQNHETSYKDILNTLLVPLIIFILIYLSIRASIYGFPTYDSVTRYVSIQHDSRYRFQTNLPQLIYPFRSDYSQLIYFPLIIHLLPMLYFRILPYVLKGCYKASTLYLICIFVFGNINEFRLLNEILPLGAVATVCIFHKYLLTSHPVQSSCESSI